MGVVRVPVHTERTVGGLYRDETPHPAAREVRYYVKVGIPLH